MRNHVAKLVGTDDLGDLVLDFLTGFLRPTTYNNYVTGVRHSTVFSFFAVTRASPRYKLPRPICFALQHGLPE
jgi:hypothetical protein